MADVTPAGSPTPVAAAKLQLLTEDEIESKPGPTRKAAKVAPTGPFLFRGILSILDLGFILTLSPVFLSPLPLPPPPHMVTHGVCSHGHNLRCAHVTARGKVYQIVYLILAIRLAVGCPIYVFRNAA